VCVGSLDNLQKQSEESINLLKEKTNNLTDYVVDIYNISRDMKYHQQQLREREMMIAIETLKSIESSMSDLKLLHDTLLSFKQSLEIIITHPAFTTNYKDDNAS